MQTDIAGRITSLVRSSLSAEGQSWDEIYNSAVEVAVFGSQAAGYGSKQSDIDIFCVGEGRRLRSAKVDLLWRTPQELRAPKWLESELAGHIARYGFWLKGEGLWKGDTVLGAPAILRKTSRILQILDWLSEQWPRLDPVFRAKYSLTLRREFRRLAILQSGQAVPPTPLLDADYQRTEEENDSRVASLRWSGRMSPYFEDRVVGLLKTLSNYEHGR